LSQRQEPRKSSAVGDRPSGSVDEWNYDIFHNVPMPKTYNTPQAAKLIGVSLITLHRWLAAEKIRPFEIELGDGRKLWRWNERDIAEGRMLKSQRKQDRDKIWHARLLKEPKKPEFRFY
jgi:hypothetical protein